MDCLKSAIEFASFEAGELIFLSNHAQEPQSFDFEQGIVLVSFLSLVDHCFLFAHSFSTMVKLSHSVFTILFLSVVLTKGSSHKVTRARDPFTLRGIDR